MEVVVPAPAPVSAPDFNFDSACSSPFMTAPSSPQRFGNFFFSAPTSPSRASNFFRKENDFSLFSGADFSLTSPSSVPFEWEEKPGISKHRNDDTDEFEFEFSGNFDRNSLFAEELFDGGKIRPLKLPPSYDSVTPVPPVSSPKSPRSRISQGKKLFQEAISPRRNKDFDPFAVAIEETCKSSDETQSHRRGRERISGSSSSSNFIRKKTRSLSPFRVSDIVFEEEESKPRKTTESKTNSNESNPNTNSPFSSVFSFSSNSFSKRYRNWKLKDFLLFRSASEGRATTSKDPLRKYTLLSRKPENVKNLSFRSTDSSGSVSKRRGPVSAHEAHYTVNRAVKEEMRKKTVLPYKHGLLGCLGFNHGMNEISKGIGSLTRG